MKLFVLIASALAQDPAAPAATNETTTQPPPTNPPATGHYYSTIKDIWGQTSPPRRRWTNEITTKITRIFLKRDISNVYPPIFMKI